MVTRSTEGGEKYPPEGTAKGETTWEKKGSLGPGHDLAPALEGHVEIPVETGVEEKNRTSYWVRVA